MEAPEEEREFCGAVARVHPESLASPLRKREREKGKNEGIVQCRRRTKDGKHSRQTGPNASTELWLLTYYAMTDIRNITGRPGVWTSYILLVCDRKGIFAETPKPLELEKKSRKSAETVITADTVIFGR